MILVTVQYVIMYIFVYRSRLQLCYHGNYKCAAPATYRPEVRMFLIGCFLFTSICLLFAQ